MRYQWLLVALLFASVHAVAGAEAAGQALPVRNGRPIVAAVDDETIALDELVFQLGPGANRARLRQGRGTAEESELLERLVNSKLIVGEAARMGLDEAAEIRMQVEVTSREILREVLIDRLVQGVTADPAAVRRRYRDLVREWRTTSLLFQDEAAAQGARKEVAAGAPFEQVAAKALAAKKARTEGDATYHARKDYLPPIAEAIAELRAGQVSPVIRIQAGFVIVQVVDIRYPESPEARAEAGRQALHEKRQAVIAAHEEALRRQYAVVKTAVLNSLDYEAPKPGMEALLKDRRVVAEIKGAEAVTVADLSDYLRLQSFHGTDQPSQTKRLNSRKETALEATLRRRLLNMDALRRGIDKTNAYRDRVRGYQDSLVFDRFVQRVVVPESKLSEEEVKGYYNGHLADYSSPRMMRLRGLAFGRRVAAEAAMQKAREGADWGWLTGNAEGQVEKGAQGLLSFDARPITTDSMPGGLQKALAGVKAGDLRLYGAPEGHFYVLSVQQVIAPQARPFDEVKEDIAKKLYGEKLKKNVESYAARLRAHSKVEIYLKRVR